jgi:outer membrane protein TolC
LSAISYFFNLLHAKENLSITRQNLENAVKLHEIAVANAE